MYDEIIELKKSLHMQKSDVDLMRTKLRRLEEENSRKDRQIEQLLDPGRVSLRAQGGLLGPWEAEGGRATMGFTRLHLLLLLAGPRLRANLGREEA